MNGEITYDWTLRLFWMAPNTDKISHLALRIITNLMRPLGLEVLYPTQTRIAWLPELGLEKFSVLPVWQFLTRSGQMSQVYLRR